MLGGDESELVFMGEQVHIEPSEGRSDETQDSERQETGGDAGLSEAQLSGEDEGLRARLAACSVDREGRAGAVVTLDAPRGFGSM